MRQGTFDLLDFVDAGLYQDEFFTLVSHEFQTPLTALKLHAQSFKRAMSRRDEIDQKKIVKLIQEIDLQSSKMSQMINLLMEISSWRVRKWKQSNDEFSFTELLSSVFENLNVPKKIHPNLFLIGDRQKLFFALHTLVKNLEEFTLIEVTSRKLKNHVCIIFKLRTFKETFFDDSGKITSGVSLGPFVHERSALGLAREIIYQHEGKISLIRLKDHNKLYVKFRSWES